MIFKSALKYKIFEWCLDTLVDNLIKNFSTISANLINADGTVNIEDLKEGMFLSEIKWYDREDEVLRVWLNCTVVWVGQDGEHGEVFTIEWNHTTSFRDGELIGGNYDRYTTVWCFDPAGDIMRDDIKFYL